MQLHSRTHVWLTHLHEDGYKMQEQESYPKSLGKLERVDMNSNLFRPIFFYQPALFQEQNRVPPHREGNPIQMPTTIPFLQIHGYRGHTRHILSGLPTPGAMYGRP